MLVSPMALCSVQDPYSPSFGTLDVSSSPILLSVTVLLVHAHELGHCDAQCWMKHIRLLK